jgi:hypothetical protein
MTYGMIAASSAGLDCHGYLKKKKIFYWDNLTVKAVFATLGILC